MSGLPPWFVAGARVRGPATTIGLTTVVVGVLVFWLLGDAIPDAVALAVTLGGFALLLVGIALQLLPWAPPVQPREVAPPVRGRWSTLNSPGSRVPSHGTHGYGQTFAIDLVYDPADDSRPRFGVGPGFRPPSDFPGFGRPLYAPDAGTVVAVRDGARDHRSRSSWAAFGYLMLEGMVRELGGTRQVVGNHVVIRLDDGVFALLAHLRQGSATVRVGQRVERGEQVASCGNTGNSSEPHVHLQLMDHRRPNVAAGLPFTFAGLGDPPANEELLVVPEDAASGT